MPKSKWSNLVEIELQSCLKCCFIMSFMKLPYIMPIAFIYAPYNWLRLCSLMPIISYLKIKKSLSNDICDFSVSDGLVRAYGSRAAVQRTSVLQVCAFIFPASIRSFSRRKWKEDIFQVLRRFSRSFVIIFLRACRAAKYVSKIFFSGVLGFRNGDNCRRVDWQGVNAGYAANIDDIGCWIATVLMHLILWRLLYLRALLFWVV